MWSAGSGGDDPAEPRRHRGLYASRFGSKSARARGRASASPPTTSRSRRPASGASAVPADVPAGRYAKEALERDKLWSAGNKDRVHAERAAGPRLCSKREAEAGFVYEPMPRYDEKVKTRRCSHATPVRYRSRGSAIEQSAAAERSLRTSLVGAGKQICPRRFRAPCVQDAGSRRGVALKLPPGQPIGRALAWAQDAACQGAFGRDVSTRCFCPMGCGHRDGILLLVRSGRRRVGGMARSHPWLTDLHLQGASRGRRSRFSMVQGVEHRVDRSNAI